MALIQRLGERKEKGNTKEFLYYQCEHWEDVEILIETIGRDLFMEVINNGLMNLGRKRIRTNSDPRLTKGQLENVRRMKDLVALGALTLEKAVQALVNSGIDEAIARANMIEKEEDADAND